jgi:GAF domain-containing protein
MTDLPRPGDDVTTSTSGEDASADAVSLQASLSDLAGLVTDSLGLEELLEQVATFAVRAIPGADGAGVTLLHVERPENRVEAIAASHPFVEEIDRIQYVSLNEGPCITAATERRTVRSGSLAEEQMWPRFGPRVGRLGVQSALSLPLMLPDQVVGAINVYARGRDAFGEHATRLGELFAVPAAVAVHNAQVLAEARKLTGHLQIALAHRPIIDQAIGLLRGRSGGDAEEAFLRLRTISQNENTKLIDVAQRIVDEAVRRARARQAGS